MRVFGMVCYLLITLLFAVVPNTMAQCTVDGNADGSGGLSFSDLMYITKFLQKAGPAPDPLCRVDMNCDCIIDTADGVALYNHLFGIEILDLPLSTCSNPTVRYFNEEPPPPCCVTLTGNVDCDDEGRVDITDLTVLIDHLFVNFPELCCLQAGNIDGDTGGKVDITDLTALIDCLFINFPHPAACQ